MRLFFFNDTATTEIYTLSLHDALPILLAEDVLWDEGGVAQRRRVKGLKGGGSVRHGPGPGLATAAVRTRALQARDRKSTRLNSSHANISYAVFCLKKNTIHRPLASPSS